MKYTLTMLLSLALFSACNDMAKQVDDPKKISTDLVKNNKTLNANTETIGMPIISFEKEEHDFGNLIDGEKVTYSFRFQNTGDAPLIISEAKGSCGCTVPNYPKKPIKAGEEASIDVTFDSKGRTGKQTKAVTIIANTNPNRKVIRINSEVISE